MLGVIRNWQSRYLPQAATPSDESVPTEGCQDTKSTLRFLDHVAKELFLRYCSALINKHLIRPNKCGLPMRMLDANETFVRRLFAAHPVEDNE